MRLHDIVNQITYCPGCANHLDGKFATTTQARLSCARDGEFFIRRFDGEWVVVFLAKIDPDELATVGWGFDVLELKRKKLVFCPLCASELVDATLNDEQRKECNTHGAFTTRMVEHAPTIVYLLEAS